MLIWFALLFLYSIYSAWQVLKPETMQELKRKGFVLSQSEYKIALNEAKFLDKLKAFPKYFLGFYIQPQMLFFYVVALIVWFVKFK